VGGQQHPLERPEGIEKRRQKIPAEHCRLIGQNGRWRFDPAATAMDWSPDIDKKISPSGSFLISWQTGYPNRSLPAATGSVEKRNHVEAVGRGDPRPFRR
jgi:hypothetical protein